MCQIQWSVAPISSSILFCTVKGQHVPNRELDQGHILQMGGLHKSDTPQSYLISSIHSTSSKIKKKKILPFIQCIGN